MATRLLGLILVSLHPVEENLLLNPGFDNLNPEGKPTHWDSFVMPQKGAAAAIDVSDKSGRFAARLHNPELYPQEPANNWSQIVLQPLDGKTLTLSGSIRAQDATEAALWIQCWAANPRRVLSAQTTSTEYPVYGTRDWTPVSTKLEVPENTEFIVVRCVLRGRGTAWFDDIALAEVKPEPPVLEFIEDNEIDEKLKVDNRTKQTLVETDTALRGALDEMRLSNEALAQEIGRLQRRIDTLRLDVARPDLPAPEASEKKPQLPPLKYGHPLIPRGYIPEPTP